MPSWSGLTVMVGLLELGRRNVAERFEPAAAVAPRDPLKSRELDVLEVAARRVRRPPADDPPREIDDELRFPPDTTRFGDEPAAVFRAPHISQSSVHSVCRASSTERAERIGVRASSDSPRR